ncbi:hypothetical protein H4R19_004315 [Coemansia spiralis]|nr:hypothetical protein H4R19_004315 [Coemansia spiralis]
MDTIILAASALVFAIHARAAWRPANILGRAAARAVWRQRHGAALVSGHPLVKAPLPIPVTIPSVATARWAALARHFPLVCGALFLGAFALWVYKARKIVRARNNAVAERLADERALEDVTAHRIAVGNAARHLADQRLAAEADRQNTVAEQTDIEATRDAAAVANVDAEAAWHDAAGQLAAAEAVSNDGAAWDTAIEAATDEAAPLRAAAEDAAAKLANATERAETLSNRVDDQEQRWNTAQAALEADIRTALEPTQDENATPAQCAAAEREAGQIRYRLRWMQLAANLAEANHVFYITDEKARELSGKVTDQCVVQTEAEFAIEEKIYDFEDEMKREKKSAREYLELAAQLKCRCLYKTTVKRTDLLYQIRGMFK